MTGEMAWIKPDGTDSNGDKYAVHAQVARAMRCRLRPFDVYIGPYIAHKRGRIFISINDDGFSATVCLWSGGIAPAFCKPVVAQYAPFNDVDAALVAARTVVAKRGER